jgi:hypothetical protein
MLVMSPFANMPPELEALAKATVDEVAAGRNPVFAGLLKDQAGAEKVAAGKVMDDAALSGMQWLVEGVEGKLT